MKPIAKKTLSMALMLLLLLGFSTTRLHAASTETDLILDTPALYTIAKRDAYTTNLIDEMACGGAYADGNYWTGGGMCYGFTKMVVQRLYGIDAISWDYGGTECAPTMQTVARLTADEYSYENLCAFFASARPGDVFQVDAVYSGGFQNQHTMVFYGYYPSDDPAEAHVRIYDANGDGRMTIQFMDLYFANDARRNPYVTLGSARAAMSLVRVIPAESLTLNKTILPLYVGEQYALYASVTPDFYSAALQWKSSDESVAVVDEFGNVTALRPGEVAITASTRDGSVQARCDVYIDDIGNSLH